MADSGSRVLREWNEKRQLERALQERSRKQVRESGFAGAAINRLTSSLMQWSGSVNADLDAALVVLRARARGLCANNEFGRRFLTLCASNIVGPAGPTLQVRAVNQNGELDKPANDAIETHWARWAKQCDVRGQMPLSLMLRVIAKAVARDGEALVRPVRNRDLPYGLQLQLMEADRLDETLNRRLENGNMVRMGVEFDSALRPIAYHIKTWHPGENHFASAGRVGIERVLARDLYHVYLPERAEQVRGYTWFHAVLMRMNMLHGYEEAAVIAARVGASKMGFFTHEEGSQTMPLAQLVDAKDTAGTLQMSAEPGEFMDLPKGVGFETFNPDYPHANFEAFLKQCLRGVASGIDVATHNLSGDMTEVNYSSARIAELVERDQWMVLQDWLICSLLVPVFKDWLGTALLKGAITMLQSGKTLPADRLAKFEDAARFQGRRWTWVDPANDTKAMREQIAEGVTSRTAVCASQGREFEDVVDELKQEKALLDAAGIVLTPLKAGAPAAQDTTQTQNA